MPTTTLRQSHTVARAYSDLTTSIPGAANKAGFVKHFGGNEVEVVLGGSAQPGVTVRGSPLPVRGEEWAEADHIWVRCPQGGAAVVGFIEISE